MSDYRYNIMLDLETLGTKPGCSIISIGAVRMDMRDYEIVDRFHCGIDPTSCEAFGLKMEASTVSWWLDDQRDAARHEWNGMDLVDLATALEGFAGWMKDTSPVWGNGANFDNVILRAAYEAAGMSCPFGFAMDRCFRTLKSTFPVEYDRKGTHHNALDDATTQAQHLFTILSKTL